MAPAGGFVSPLRPQPKAPLGAMAGRGPAHTQTRFVQASFSFRSRFPPPKGANNIAHTAVGGPRPAAIHPARSGIRRARRSGSRQEVGNVRGGRLRRGRDCRHRACDCVFAPVACTRTLRHKDGREKFAGEFRRRADAKGEKREAERAKPLKPRRPRPDRRAGRGCQAGGRQAPKGEQAAQSFEAQKQGSQKGKAEGPPGKAAAGPKRGRAAGPKGGSRMGACCGAAQGRRVRHGLRAGRRRERRRDGARTGRKAGLPRQAPGRTSTPSQERAKGRGGCSRRRLTPEKRRARGPEQRFVRRARSPAKFFPPGGSKWAVKPHRKKDRAALAEKLNRVRQIRESRIAGQGAGAEGRQEGGPLPAGPRYTSAPPRPRGSTGLKQPASAAGSSAPVAKIPRRPHLRWLSRAGGPGGSPRRPDTTNMQVRAGAKPRPRCRSSQPPYQEVQVAPGAAPAVLPPSRAGGAARTTPLRIAGSARTPPEGVGGRRRTVTRQSDKVGLGEKGPGGTVRLWMVTGNLRHRRQCVQGRDPVLWHARRDANQCRRRTRPQRSARAPRRWASANQPGAPRRSLAQCAWMRLSGHRGSGVPARYLQPIDPGTSSRHDGRVGYAVAEGALDYRQGEAGHRERGRARDSSRTVRAGG